MEDDRTPFINKLTHILLTLCGAKAKLANMMGLMRLGKVIKYGVLSRLFLQKI